MRLYKLFSLTCTVIFAVVGFVFLFYPNAVLIFFNSLSRHWGWAPSPVQGASFYLTPGCGLYVSGNGAGLPDVPPSGGEYLSVFIGPRETGIIAVFHLSIFDGAALPGLFC